MQTRKTESSLLRLRQGVLKRGSAGTDSGESNISATDKICRQLYLDVQVENFEISMPLFCNLIICYIFVACVC
mgnify:FL=1